MPPPPQHGLCPLKLLARKKFVLKSHLSGIWSQLSGTCVVQEVSRWWQGSPQELDLWHCKRDTRELHITYEPENGADRQHMPACWSWVPQLPERWGTPSPWYFVTVAPTHKDTPCLLSQVQRLISLWIGTTRPFKFCSAILASFSSCSNVLEACEEACQPIKESFGGRDDWWGTPCAGLHTMPCFSEASWQRASSSPERSPPPKCECGNVFPVAILGFPGKGNFPTDCDVKTEQAVNHLRVPQMWMKSEFSFFLFSFEF